MLITRSKCIGVLAACGFLAASCTESEPSPGDVDAATIENRLPFVCLWFPEEEPGCDEGQLSFAAVSPGKASVRKLLVRHRGDAPATLTVTPFASWVSVDGGLIFEMMPGEAEILTLRVSPDTPPGIHLGSVKIAVGPIELFEWDQRFEARVSVLECAEGTSNCDGDWATGCECPFQCKPWHFGRACEPCPGLPAEPCTGRGLCDDGEYGSGLCGCETGWIGAACEIDVNECNFDPCHQKAVCENLPGTFTCTCEAGWVGTGFNCSPSPCGPLQVENGPLLPTSDHGQSIEDFTCDEGFEPDTETAPLCEFGAWWTPSCVPLPEP